MFLSDTLIEIGRKSNPNNNLSQANQCQKMLDILNLAQKNGDDTKRLQNITLFVVKQLNKEGFLYFSFGKFWKIEMPKP